MWDRLKNIIEKNLCHNKADGKFCSGRFGSFGRSGKDRDIEKQITQTAKDYYTTHVKKLADRMTAWDVTKAHINWLTRQHILASGAKPSLSKTIWNNRAIKKLASKALRK